MVAVFYVSISGVMVRAAECIRGIPEHTCGIMRVFPCVDMCFISSAPESVVERHRLGTHCCGILNCCCKDVHTANWEYVVSSVLLGVGGNDMGLWLVTSQLVPHLN